MQEFQILDVDGLKVIRDDLFEGGTKRRAFSRLIHKISEKELVYAADYYGHAAYAIALVTESVNKKVKLFYPSPVHTTDVFKKTIKFPHVSYEIVEHAQTQVEASKSAIVYAEQHNARFFTIGMDFQDFVTELIEVVKFAKIDGPEIWCMGGSGALSRSLQIAYPHIPVHVISVGTSNANFEGVYKVFKAPEILDEEAEIKPPYPSNTHYDAKVWRFVKQHAKKGAYVWNVAP